MALEIELKFEVDDFKKPHRKLKELGAKLEWEGEEEIYFFDTPEKKLKSEDKILRLKKMNNKILITLKIKTGKEITQYHIREEFEIESNSLDETKAIFKALGFVESFKYKKYRQHWKINNTAIELDALKNKYFVEIEGTKEKIKELAQELSLDWSKSTAKGYPSIIKEANL